MTHKLENNCIKEVLALLQKFYGPQQIPKPGDPAKGLRTPKEFDFEGQWDLITELSHDWGRKLLEGTNKMLCTPGPRERSGDPTRDCARLACECPGVSGRGVDQQWPAAESGL